MNFLAEIQIKPGWDDEKLKEALKKLATEQRETSRSKAVIYEPRE